MGWRIDQFGGAKLHSGNWAGGGQAVFGVMTETSCRRPAGRHRGRQRSDCVEKPAPETGAGAILIVVRRLVPRLCGGCGGWHGDQLGHLAEVLGGGGEEELVSCAVWTSQAQAIHSEDALEVREQHLNLLSLAA